MSNLNYSFVVQDIFIKVVREENANCGEKYLCKARESVQSLCNRYGCLCLDFCSINNKTKCNEIRNACTSIIEYVNEVEGPWTRCGLFPFRTQSRIWMKAKRQAGQEVSLVATDQRRNVDDDDGDDDDDDACD